MIGLSFALLMRIGLLAGITWIIGITKPLFEIEALDHSVSVKDIILLLGGLFLIMKSTLEIGSIKWKGLVWIRRKLKSLNLGLLSYRLF